MGRLPSHRTVVRAAFVAALLLAHSGPEARAEPADPAKDEGLALGIDRLREAGDAEGATRQAGATLARFPDSPSVQAAWSRALRRVGRSAEVLSRLDAWIEAAERAKDDGARDVLRSERVMAMFSTGQFEEAEQELSERDARDPTGWTTAWLWVVRARLGDGIEAASDLWERLDGTSARSLDPRARDVMEYVAERRTAVALVARADGGSSAGAERARAARARATAWFFVAERHRSAGDRAGALDAYRRVVATKAETPNETVAAIEAIADLEQGKGPLAPRPRWSSGRGPPASVRVEFRHADGTPAPGARVHHVLQGRWTAIHTFPESFAYDLPLPDDQPTRIRATPRGWAWPIGPERDAAWERRAVRARPGDSVVLTVDPVAAVEVVVRDAPRLLHAHLEEQEPPEAEGRGFDVHDGDSTDGRFRFTEARPGARHVLHVRDEEGRRCAVLDDVRPPASLAVPLVPVAPILGRVTPLPAPGRPGQVLCLSRGIALDLDIEEDGTFAIRALPAGTWSFVATVASAEERDANGDPVRFESRFRVRAGRVIRVVLHRATDDDERYDPVEDLGPAPIPPAPLPPRPVPPVPEPPPPAPEPPPGPPPEVPSAGATATPEDATAAAGVDRLRESGDVEGAWREAKRVLASSPSCPAVQAAWSRAARRSDRTTDALARLDAWIAAADRTGVRANLEPLLWERALARLGAGRGAEAEQGFSECAILGDLTGRADAWTWVANVRERRDWQARSWPRRALDSVRVQDMEGGWRRILEYIAGRRSAEDLVAAARKGDDGEGARLRSARALADTWFFIGEKRCADGSRAEAIAAYREAVATKAETPDSTVAAVERLAAMEADPSLGEPRPERRDPRPIVHLRFRHSDGTPAPHPGLWVRHADSWTPEMTIEGSADHDFVAPDDGPRWFRACPEGWGRPSFRGLASDAWERKAVSARAGDSIVLTVEDVAPVTVTVSGPPRPLHARLLEPPPAASAERAWDDHTLWTSAGVFRFTEVRPGARHSLHVWDDEGRECVVLDDVRAPATLDLALVPSAPITGRVTPKPALHDFTSVTLEHAGIDVRLPIGEDGRFAVRALPAGTWTFHAFVSHGIGKDRTEAREALFQVRGGRDVRVALHPFGEREGRVPVEDVGPAHAPDGNPEAGPPAAVPSAPNPAPGTPAGSDPDDPLRAGREALAAFDLAGALEAADRILRRDPEDIGARALQGEARRWKGDTRGALDDYAVAGQKAPEDPDVAAGWARALRSTGDASGGLAKVSAAIARHPDHVGLLLLRSQLREATGDPAGAVSDAVAAVRRAPEDAAARLRLYSASVRQGKAASAAKEIADWLATAPVATKNSWEGRLASIAAGTATFDAVFAAARDVPATAGAETARKVRRCQAFVVGALFALGKNDKDLARTRLALATSLGASACDEHALATDLLRAPGVR